MLHLRELYTLSTYTQHLLLNIAKTQVKFYNTTGSKVASMLYSNAALMSCVPNIGNLDCVVLNNKLRSVKDIHTNLR